MRALVLTLVFALSACGPLEEETPDCHSGVCPACDACACSGLARLEARSLSDDYAAATFSFEHATAVDSEAVRNDWDLLFGNDSDPSTDSFTVNTVTDDRSFIVDLGPRRSFCDVPEEIDPNAFPVGAFGDHDDVEVVQGHVYVIRTADSETRQWSVVWVVEHDPNRSVTISWYRSPSPDRFVPPRSCDR